MSQAVIDSTKVEPRDAGDLLLRFALQGGAVTSLRVRREAAVRLIAQLEIEVMPTREEREKSYREVTKQWPAHHARAFGSQPLSHCCGTLARGEIINGQARCAHCHEWATFEPVKDDEDTKEAPHA